MRPVGRFASGLASLAVAIMLAWVVACGGGTQQLDNQNLSQVRGTVIEVVARNIVELETLRIRDQAGKDWVFGAGQGFIGFSPSHLREHQISGESVLVSFITQGDEMVAVDIAD